MLHKGKILKELIKSSSYTQATIAEKIDINKSQFSTLLNRPDIKEEIIDSVCEALGINKEEHFFISTPTLDYKSRYEALQEKYFEEKTQLLNQVQQLMAENHALKNEILELKEK